MTAATRGAGNEAVTFDPAEHRYYVDGRWVRSVTQVLKLVTDYSAVPEFVLEYARVRGSNVHGWTELIDLGEATVSRDAIQAADGVGLTPEHAEWGYVQAWQRFREESGFVPEVVEQLLYHPRHRYCGTVDRIGRINGRLTTLEIKTVAQLDNWVALQTAAYHEAYNHGLPRDEQAKGRVAVQLKGDGTYRVEVYRDAADLSVFLAMKHVWDWCDRNGTTPAIPAEKEQA